jgi:Pre-mRNA splicing factor PRP21 like protein
MYMHSVLTGSMIAVLTCKTIITHNTQTVIDPISGKSVPLSQLSDHMRIQLMDPKYVLILITSLFALHRVV